MRHPNCDVPHPHGKHIIPGGVTESDDFSTCNGDDADNQHPTGIEAMAEQRELDLDIGGGGLGAVLRDWWIDLAAQEADRVVPKAVEYGATDLIEIGRTLGQCTGWADLSTEEQAELGVYFYLVGKMARWTDAIKERRQVSDDTLHDIGVYVRMAQRIRQVGGWPFGPMEKEQGE